MFGYDISCSSSSTYGSSRACDFQSYPAARPTPQEPPDHWTVWFTVSKICFVIAGLLLMALIILAVHPQPPL